MDFLNESLFNELELVVEADKKGKKIFEKIATRIKETGLTWINSSNATHASVPKQVEGTKQLREC